MSMGSESCCTSLAPCMRRVPLSPCMRTTLQEAAKCLRDRQRAAAERLRIAAAAGSVQAFSTALQAATDCGVPAAMLQQIKHSWAGRCDAAKQAVSDAARAKAFHTQTFDAAKMQVLRPSHWMQPAIMPPCIWSGCCHVCTCTDACSVPQVLSGRPSATTPRCARPHPQCVLCAHT
jgi:hypothetical protein